MSVSGVNVGASVYFFGFSCLLLVLILVLQFISLKFFPLLTYSLCISHFMRYNNEVTRGRHICIKVQSHQNP